MLKDIARYIAPTWVQAARHKSYYRDAGTLAYSQEGEDILLRRIFPGRAIGFYVDVGAYHPIEYSNTYGLYQLGWRGVNIDARPGSMRAFSLLRSEDTNVEVAIAEQEGWADYCEFQHAAYNGIVLGEPPRGGTGGKTLKQVRSIRTRPLRDVLAEYVPSGTEIDFFSIDIEGIELQVLRSNDWATYRPKAIMVEETRSTIVDIVNSEIATFLAGHGYVPFSKCVNTVVYVDRSFAHEVMDRSSGTMNGHG